MNKKELLKKYFNEFKNQYKELDGFKDFTIFTAMCIKYFYYSSGMTNYEVDKVKNYLVDGSNDGGIDAVFNNPDSDNNNLVIVQSKFYSETTIQFEKIFGELVKINETIKALDKHKVEGFSKKMVQAYRTAISEMEDNAKRELVFFASVGLPSKRDKDKLLRQLEEYFPGYEIDLFFIDDIISQIESCNSNTEFIGNDFLLLDKTNNALRYQDSIIVNISAKSLQDLQNRRGKSLLGMNLRYHIKDNKVDNAIADTIINEPENFWYKNNGILIICDDYLIDDKKLNMINFSVVNGGQTTHKIGNIDISENDFFIQCKVVKSKGNNQKEKDTFITNIAEATNSQKPIKNKDLKANSVEQKQLKHEFANIEVYYIIKNGDKPYPANKYIYPYSVTNLEKVGKVSLAGVLQMPGTARNNSTKMYDDAYYYSIFGSSSSPKFIADLLKIDYYYEKYIKSDLSIFDDDTIAIIKNGRTFAISCISFICKISRKVFAWKDIKNNLNDIEELKKKLRKMDNLDCIIKNKRDDEQELFNKIFALIGYKVIGPCYKLAKARGFGDSKVIAASDYLKNDNNYYQEILHSLYSEYSLSNDLKSYLNLLIN